MKIGALMETFPASPEFSSRERIANHIELMRKFKCILDDAEKLDRHTQAFPPGPTQILGQNEESKWRVQCLLMSAEIRYSRYLLLLDKWITSHGFQSPKDEWPLPPWDVAIIFYAHLLSPFNFKNAMESHFPSLWKAEIEFPLARILSTNTDEASKLVWEKEYPDIPYQIVEFTPAGDPIYITQNGMDIHGYRCGSRNCAVSKTYVIPMTQWAKFCVGYAELVCPGCKTRTRATKANPVLKHCHRAFRFPVFKLWDSPQRQFGNQGFVDRILALTLTESQFPEHVSRYLKFLQLMKENESTLVPTLDIDLLWHTHQLSPVAYEKYCKTHVGRGINHVDTIRAAKRSNNEDNTASLWAIRYGESYFDPQNADKTAEIKKRQAACEKDSQDIGTKLAAYDDDHKQLKTELDEIKDRSLTKLASYREAEDAAMALRTKMAGIQTSIQSIKPKFRFLKLRYYSKSQKQQREELESKLTSLSQESLVREREMDRCGRDYRSAFEEQTHKIRLWDMAQRERKRLEERLALQVTEAKAAIWRVDVNKGRKYQEYRYNGSWYSIVPSEAQQEVYPILGTKNDRNIYYQSIGFIGFFDGGAGGCGGGGCGGGGCGGGGCGGGCGGG